jgi:hypothetical protein
VERISTRTDTAGRQQPASKQPKPQSVEARRRDMRDQQAGEVEGRSAAPVPAPSDAGRVQNAILQAYVALKATDKADLRAGCRGLDTDQIALAVDHIDGCLARLRKLQMALRGDE